MIERAASSPPVPERYIGLWRRRLLQDARGEDRTTQVYWLQTGSLYADIRVPVERLERITAESLAHQQGCAGALEVEDNILTWRRWLDFQPPARRPDVGRMQFIGLNEMVEDGVHTAYREVWERIGMASGDRAAFSLQVEYADGALPRRRAGVLVTVGDFFMFALDRLEALPEREGLADLLQDPHLSAPQHEQLFACEISLGRRRTGALPWEITLSTLPKNEGYGLFEIHGALTRTATGQFEQRLPQALSHPSGRRIWRQIERGDQFLEFV